MVLTDFQIVVLYNMLTERIFRELPVYPRGGHHNMAWDVIVHNAVIRRCAYIMPALEWLSGEYRSFRYPNPDPYIDTCGYTLKSR